MLESCPYVKLNRIIPIHTLSLRQYDVLGAKIETVVDGDFLTFRM